MRRILLVLILLSTALCLDRTARAQSSALATAAGSMAAGEWRQLITNGPSTEAIYPSNQQGILPYSSNLAWDSTHHVGYFFGGEHNNALVCAGAGADTPECADTAQRFLRYDETSNSWGLLYDEVTGKPHSGRAGDHSNDHLTIDPSTGDVYKYWAGGTHSLQKFPYSGTRTWTNLTNPDYRSDVVGFAWWPAISGLIAFNPSFGFVNQYTAGTDTWTQPLTGLTSYLGAYGAQAFAFYNPSTQHVAIFGAPNPAQIGTDRERSFLVLAYSSGAIKYVKTDGSLTTDPSLAVRLIPVQLHDSIGRNWICSGSGEGGTCVIDPVTGHYLGIYREADATARLIDYDEANDTWTLQTSDRNPPAAIANRIGINGAAGLVAAIGIPEYGVVMFLTATPTGADTWLYKHSGGGSGGDVTPPSTPTGLTVTAVSATNVELMWTASTDAVGVAGYRIYRNNAQVGTAFYPIFNDTNRIPNTSYSYKVAAVDAAGNLSSTSSTVSATTDLQLYTFAQKCAMPGVLKCVAFDNQSELRYTWETAVQAPAYGAVCDTYMANAGYTWHAFDPTVSDYANTIVTYINGACNAPLIDSSVKFDGAGSLKFTVPNHSGAAPGDYIDVFKKYGDGTFGYVGPTTPLAAPYNTARHEGDTLYMQWRQRYDGTMLTTSFKQVMFGANGEQTSNALGTFSTSGAGATTVTAAVCLIDDGAVGHTIRFGWGTNFDITQNFTISAVGGGSANARCTMTLTASPTPSGAGSGGFGWISGTSQTAGWKSFGIFGNPPNSTCCNSAAQVMLNGGLTGAPSTYSYNGSSTVSYETTDGIQGVRGCEFVYPLQYDNGTTYPEPPCKRFVANQWHEFYAIVTPAITPCETGPYTGRHQVWMDGQKISDISGYALCRGAGVANGLGQFVLNVYNTNKDPNQTHSTTYSWYDDVIISTAPIPMGTDVSGGSTDNTAPTVTLTAPRNNSTVVGSILLQATASDNVGVAGVQFHRDGGIDIGAEDTVAPYRISFNTVDIPVGTHTIGATARDAAGNRTTATVTITIQRGKRGRPGGGVR